MKNGKPFPIPIRVKKTVKYSCEKCPGYCCSYTEIEITMRDVERLARHFGIGPAAAQERFSANAIGYVDASFSAGSNLVANPLNAGNNTISNLFCGVPEGSVFLPWDPDVVPYGSYSSSNR